MMAPAVETRQTLRQFEKKGNVFFCTFVLLFEHSIFCFVFVPALW